MPSGPTQATSNSKLNTSFFLDSYHSAVAPNFNRSWPNTPESLCLWPKWCLLQNLFITDHFSGPRRVVNPVCVCACVCVCVCIMVWIISDGVSRHVSCIATVSRHSFSRLGGDAVSTLVTMSCLGSVSSFHVSSCLMFHDCVLTVSLSGVSKCLFWAEPLTFLADSRPLCSFTRRLSLLTYCKTVVLVFVVFYGYNVSL